ISGIPAGLVAANSESLLAGKGFAAGNKQFESVVTFSLMGGGFALGKAKLADMAGPDAARPASSEPNTFRSAGVDVDGRPVDSGARANVAKNLPDYRPAELSNARSQTIVDLSEINSSTPGKSVLDQFKNSGLSITQKYRVLSSLSEVREHFVNQ